MTTRKPKRRPAPPSPEEIAAQARRDFAASGGHARAVSMTAERRAEIARAAAAKRWAAKRQAKPDDAA